jgi:hypothetical protein
MSTLHSQENSTAEFSQVIKLLQEHGYVFRVDPASKRADFCFASDHSISRGSFTLIPELGMLRISLPMGCLGVMNDRAWGLLFRIQGALLQSRFDWDSDMRILRIEATAPVSSSAKTAGVLRHLFGEIRHVLDDGRLRAVIEMSRAD